MCGDDEGIAVRFPMPKLTLERDWAEEFQDWHLDPQFLQKDLDRIIEGFGLLRDKVKKFGKPRGSRTYSQADFFDAAVQAFCRCYERGDKRPSDLDVAGQMNLSKSAFNAHKRNYGIRQSDIRVKAMRRIDQEG